MSVVPKLRNHCIDGEEKMKDWARGAPLHVRSKVEEEEAAEEIEKEPSAK